MQVAKRSSRAEDDNSPFTVSPVTEEFPSALKTSPSLPQLSPLSSSIFFAKNSNSAFRPAVKSTARKASTSFPSSLQANSAAAFASSDLVTQNSDLARSLHSPCRSTNGLGTTVGTNKQKSDNSPYPLFPQAISSYGLNIGSNPALTQSGSLSRLNDPFLTYLLKSPHIPPFKSTPEPKSPRSSSTFEDHLMNLSSFPSNNLGLSSFPHFQYSSNFNQSLDLFHHNHLAQRRMTDFLKRKASPLPIDHGLIKKPAMMSPGSVYENSLKEENLKIEISHDVDRISDDVEDEALKCINSLTPHSSMGKFLEDAVSSRARRLNSPNMNADIKEDGISKGDNKNKSFDLDCQTMDYDISKSESEKASSEATNDKSRSVMYKTFQDWALKNYGDSGKTKTVTRNKYRRIVRILSGEELFTAENSKFRFWVKAKGFRLAPEKPGHVDEHPELDRVVLVPSKHAPDGSKGGAKCLKRVAIVEDFFDIIYNVHVEMDGRGGKHAGQKRTYRAIAETYSFLPREAVTRFLMSCTDCQKRMHLSHESNNNTPSSTDDHNDKQVQHPGQMMKSSVIDFCLPITQTYLNHMRHSVRPFSQDDSDHDDESMSSDSVTNREMSPEPKDDEDSVDAVNNKEEHRDDEGTVSTSLTINNNNNNDKHPGSTSPLPHLQRTNKSTEDSVFEEPKDMSASRKASPRPSDMEVRTSVSPVEIGSRKDSPIPGKLIEGKGHPERKRRASSESGDSAMTKTSEGKDEDDDDDNDDDERIPTGHDIDPERLKAFNMFVRLFVDENLDRMVPISKQPKDKIQAILEACDRQFPEFHERSRKRIRTYLKSCRRMRRSKDHNGWEPLRPTPPHLTSAAAEGLLATACENESQNAKRMRLGLEPLPASAMVSHNIVITSQAAPATVSQPPNQPAAPVSQATTQPSSHSVNSCSVPAATDFLRHQPQPPTFRPAPEFTPSFFANGHGTAAALFRPGFPGYQHPAHHHPTVLPHAPITASANTNGEFGPTDLSMKKSGNKGQLSTSEVTTIKQLIAGYKESAAFLYRSADELEQLLLQQN